MMLWGLWKWQNRPPCNSLWESAGSFYVNSVGWQVGRLLIKRTSAVVPFECRITCWQPLFQSYSHYHFPLRTIENYFYRMTEVTAKVNISFFLLSRALHSHFIRCTAIPRFHLNFQVHSLIIKENYALTKLRFFHLFSNLKLVYL